MFTINAKKHKLKAQKIDYIRAILWFRGGTKQDAIETFNYWNSVYGGINILNAYLDAFLKDGYAQTILKQEELLNEQNSNPKRKYNRKRPTRTPEVHTFY